MHNKPCSSKVFIIEDDVFYAKALEKTIESGYSNINMYHSGAEVLEDPEAIPDIVLLDYWLGDINGLTIMRKLMERNPNVQIILVSGQAKLDVVVQALRLGAHEYLNKDEGLDKVLPILNNAVEISSLNSTLLDTRKKDRRMLPLIVASFVILAFITAKLMDI